MSAPLTNCDCPCPDPVITEIPGSPGEDGAAGANGTDGHNAWTTLTAPLTLPAVGFGFIASVGDSSFFAIGQNIFASDGTHQGNFQVAAVPTPTSVDLTFLGYPGDSAPGQNINVGGKVTPAGLLTPLATPLPNAFTDNSGATASDTIAVGVGMNTWVMDHTFIGGTAAVEPCTNYTVGFKFKIISWAWITGSVLTGGGGSRVANMEINSTDVGTVPSTLTITTASGTVGVVIPGTAIAGANTGSATDTFSIEIAAGGTAITGGEGHFVVLIQNLDTANAIASLADHVNSLIISLT